MLLTKLRNTPIVYEKDLKLEGFELKEQTRSEMEEIISAGQLLKILNSDAKEVSALCQKACLKPKKDGFGNIYFSKSDIDVLKKVKELYEHTRKLQEEKKRNVEEAIEKFSTVEQENPEKNQGIKENNFLTRAKNRFAHKVTESVAVSPISDLDSRIENLENNIVSRITDVLSEKIDGLDEVVVELIRAKTENESLRQKLNELNKENFSLKNENASYKSVGLGFYVKKNTDDFVF